MGYFRLSVIRILESRPEWNGWIHRLELFGKISCRSRTRKGMFYHDGVHFEKLYSLALRTTVLGQKKHMIRIYYN